MSSSCPGFLDEHGIWNNGFECPSLPDQIRVCCGSDSRRYCCRLKSPVELISSSTEPTSSLLKKINFTWLTLSILLTSLAILLLLILFLCYQYHQRKNTSEHISPKETLLVEHFPFSPPHHQLVFNETNPPSNKEILSTSTSSSSPARFPSESYFNDWREFFQPIEQSMNVYPLRYYYSQDEVIV